MQFKLSNLTFALFAFAVTTGVNASPVTPADGLPGGIVSSEQLDHWLATTDAKLTFIGDPAGVNGRLNPLASRQGPGVLATRVVYCSTRSHNVCGGACTVYNGGAACLNAPGTQCLTADRNVAFCDRARCSGSCNQLSTCGTRLDGGYCYTPGTNSIIVPHS